MLENNAKEFENLIELIDELDNQHIIGLQRKTIIDRFLMERAAINKIPYSGSFELTPLCNLDCRMCYVHLDKKQLSGSVLDTTEWIHIAEQAISAGMVNAEITGGECLYYPGFKDFYLFLQSRGIRISVLTNAVLFNDETVNFLRINKPTIVQISLYGSSDDVYERVTGYRVYSQVMKSIYKLREAGIRVRISITPNRFMEDDIYTLIELVRSMDIEYSVSGVTLAARTETGRDINEYAINENKMIELQKNENEYRIKKLLQNSLQNNIRYQYHAKGMRQEGVPCSSGKCAFHVNWKGELTPCIPFQSVAYSVLEYGFIGAWNMVNARMMSYTQPVECIKCEYRDICIMCPADRTAGVYGGKLNIAACNRMKAYIEAGIIKTNKFK